MSVRLELARLADVAGFATDPPPRVSGIHPLRWARLMWRGSGRVSALCRWGSTRLLSYLHRKVYYSAVYFWCVALLHGGLLRVCYMCMLSRLFAFGLTAVCVFIYSTRLFGHVWSDPRPRWEQRLPNLCGKSSSWYPHERRRGRVLQIRSDPRYRSEKPARWPSVCLCRVWGPQVSESLA